MLKILLFMMALLITTPMIYGQDVTKIEVFGGYSLLRDDLGGDNPKLSGFDTSITYNMNHILGFKAVFSGHFNGKTPVIVRDVFPRPLPPFPDPFPTPGPGSFSGTLKTSNYLFMVGPQITFRRQKKLSPFGHVLLGMVKRNAMIPVRTPFSDPTIREYVKGSDTGFGIGTGGGIDYKIMDKVYLRIFQFDYIRGMINGYNSDIFKLSVGIKVDLK